MTTILAAQRSETPPRSPARILLSRILGHRLGMIGIVHLGADTGGAIVDALRRRHVDAVAIRLRRLRRQHQHVAHGHVGPLLRQEAQRQRAARAGAGGYQAA